MLCGTGLIKMLIVLIGFRGLILVGFIIVAPNRITWRIYIILIVIFISRMVNHVSLTILCLLLIFLINL